MVHETGARQYVAENEWCTRVRSGARVVHEIMERFTSVEWCTRTSGAREGMVHEIAARVRVVHEMGAREYVAVHE